MRDPSWSQIDQTRRHTEIRRRLQELATQSMAASDAEFKAIGKESMALWTEFNAINRVEKATQQPGGCRTPQGHLLWTSWTCPNRDKPEHEDEWCNICDHGLSICSLCGMAEAELDQPCPGKQEERPSDANDL